MPELDFDSHRKARQGSGQTFFTSPCRLAKRRSMRSMPAGKYRWLFSRVKYFNNIEEQDHRSVKRVSSQMLGFKAFQSGKNVLAEIELMHMIRKGWLMTEGSDEMSIADQFYALPGQIRPLLGTAGRDHPKSALPSLMLQNLFLKGSHCLQCSLSENPCMWWSNLNGHNDRFFQT